MMREVPGLHFSPRGNVGKERSLHLLGLLYVPHTGASYCYDREQRCQETYLSPIPPPLSPSPYPLSPVTLWGPRPVRRCFCSFVDQFAPNIFTTAPDKPPVEGGQGTFVVLEVHLLVLEQLLRYHDPVLAAHFEECCISADAYATSWSVNT